VRRALYAAGVSAAGSDFNGGSLFRSVVGYGLFMGTVTLFWAPVVARFGRWRLALAPLLVMGVFSFVTLQRFAFVYSVLMFVFAAAYHRLPAPVRLRRAGASFRKPAVVLALLLPVMVYAPLKLRQPDLTPAKAVESVTAYFTGGAGALNEQIRQFGFQPRDGKAGHGGWILWGEGTIAARLGAHVDLPPKDLPYVDVGARSPVLSNVYTYLAYAMNDFGPLGLVVCPFLFGLVASAVGYLALVRRRRAWIPAAAILMTSVAMSFFGLSLVRDTRYVAVACAAPLLERLIRPRGARAPLALGSGNAC
jgi:oligosaccharide repeat unit polymerase